MLSHLIRRINNAKLSDLITSVAAESASVEIEMDLHNVARELKEKIQSPASFSVLASVRVRENTPGLLPRTSMFRGK